MALAVRPASLEADRDQIIEATRQFLSPDCDERRFDWLYRENPHGRARVWIAEDLPGSTTVGIAAAFPRRLYINGAPRLGAILGDFCINPQYRALGPALQLQRACMTVVDCDSIELCYDFPSLSMAAIYERLRIKLLARVIRYARLLRVDRKISEAVKIRILARGLSGIANGMLAVLSGKPSEISGFTMCLESESFGEEYSILARRIEGQLGICVERSAEYLNWRYFSSPLCRFEVLTARRNNSLYAYIIFTRTGSNATIVDVFGEQDSQVIASLIAHVVFLLRERGVVTVSAPMIERHPFSLIFADQGFRPRESSPVMVYGRAGAPGTQRMMQENWFLMQGDRDS